MTVGEFKNYQNELVRNGSKSSAGGRYQFIRGAKNKKTGEYALLK
jgi:muramidase (phage lysozyme)